MGRETDNQLLLLTDIGNSSIKLGICKGEEIALSFSLPLDTRQTVDSLGLWIEAALKFNNVKTDIGACMAVSVNPALDSLFARACKRYLGCDAAFAGHDLAIPMANAYLRPAELGMDRLVAAYAACRHYPEAERLIIADYGSAVTFDCVDQGSYQGGLIFPGLPLAAESLGRGTAKLPYVSLEGGLSGTLPCKETQTCIRDGLLLGYAALSREFCKELEGSMNGPALKVATGGYAQLLIPLASIFTEFRPNLILEGLLELARVHHIIN